MALVIRNITSKSIELKDVKLSETLHHRRSRRSTRTTNSLSPLHNKESTTETTDQQSVSSVGRPVILEPFTTTKTGIQLGEKQSLRLTFKIGSESYRLDNLTPSNSFTVLTPLSPEARLNFVAIHLARASHLTIFFSANLSSWMRALKDDIPLSALSIPGTHDSSTFHHALPSIRCQAKSFSEQLQNGVRFFDIRVKPKNSMVPAKDDGLILVHGEFPVSLTGRKYLRRLIEDIFAFQDQNPSEAVIMSIKREGTGDANDAQLSRIFRDYYADDLDRWFTAPRIPTLGESRHKIVLIRRFELDEELKNEWDGAGWGIDADNWADNTPYATTPSGDVCVQDFYDVSAAEDIDKKLKYAQEQLARASQSVWPLPKRGGPGEAESLPKQPFYINFLSGSYFWKVRYWPERIAAKLNPATIEYLCVKHNETEGADGDTDENKGAVGRGDGGTGIVVFDWEGRKGNWELAKCIVAMNARLEARE